MFFKENLCVKIVKIASSFSFGWKNPRVLGFIVEFYRKTLHLMLSVGDDKQIVTWETEDSEDSGGGGGSSVPVQTVASKQIVTGVTFHRSSDTFATCGEGSTLLWDSGR